MAAGNAHGVTVLGGVQMFKQLRSHAQRFKRTAAAMVGVADDVDDAVGRNGGALHQVARQVGQRGFGLRAPGIGGLLPMRHG
ncbi:hypothetical protein D3C78_1403330 [compost metagenome]